MNSSSETITSSSGARANRTGNQLERFVEQALQDRGYIEVPNHKYQLFTDRHTASGRQYARHVPVDTTVYGTKRVCDFLIVNEALFPGGLIMECKWQQSGGSVDEKYPFLVLNVVKTNVPTIILLDGSGYKIGAKQWLQRQARPDHALREVWDMADFQRAINNGYFG
jgi:hypothetical protein